MTINTMGVLAYCLLLAVVIFVWIDRPDDSGRR